mgnify:CR=1 FL=1
MQKLNPRQEAFARHYVRCGKARHAYSLAGYTARQPTNPGDCAPADAAASRLLKNVKVAGRIERIRQAMVKRADITEDNILNKLELVIKRAMETDQLAAANQAATAQAKLVGMLIDRKEIGDAGEFQRMTEQELRDYIANGDIVPVNTAQSAPLPTHPAPKQEQ